MLASIILTIAAAVAMPRAGAIEGGAEARVRPPGEAPVIFWGDKGLKRLTPDWPGASVYLSGDVAWDPRDDTVYAWMRRGDARVIRRMDRTGRTLAEWPIEDRVVFSYALHRRGARVCCVVGVSTTGSLIYGQLMVLPAQGGPPELVDIPLPREVTLGVPPDETVWLAYSRSLDPAQFDTASGILAEFGWRLVPGRQLGHGIVPFVAASASELLTPHLSLPVAWERGLRTIAAGSRGGGRAYLARRTGKSYAAADVTDLLSEGLRPFAHPDSELLIAAVLPWRSGAAYEVGVGRQFVRYVVWVDASESPWRATRAERGHLARRMAAFGPLPAR